MQEVSAPKNISISVQLAKELLQLIYDAKHNEYSHKVVNAVTNQLIILVREVELPAENGELVNMDAF